MESDGTAARGRLRGTDLPAGLTHGVSREFLVAEGLPETAAFLDFARPGAGLLEAPAWPDGRQQGNTGPLFVLGETQYCGSRVVLDGVTGEVHLAAWADGKVRRDRDVNATDGACRASNGPVPDPTASGERQDRVRMRGPWSVIATVCSMWAALLPSVVRRVQPSMSVR